MHCITYNLFIGKERKDTVSIAKLISTSINAIYFYFREDIEEGTTWTPNPERHQAKYVLKPLQRQHGVIVMMKIIMIIVIM